MNNDDPVADIKYFKGNQFLSLDGGMVWFLLLFPLIIIFFDGFDEVLPWMFLSYIFFFLPASVHLNYFGVSSSFLIVRNHNRIWVGKKYYFSDIEELTLDFKHGGRGCLTIRLKNGRIKNPAGASLGDKDWLELKHELIKRGVSVNDTLGYEAIVEGKNNGSAWVTYVLYFTYLLIALIVLMVVSSLPDDTMPQTIWRGVLIVAVVVGFMFSIRRVLLWVVKNDPNQRGQK